MQRQSLGSPGSKLQSHGVVSAKEDTATLEDSKRNINGASSSTPLQLIDADEVKDKSIKPHKSKSPSPSPPPKPEKFIHFIPVLTLFCFLVLYLCSHDPSQSDLAHIDGFKRSSKPTDSVNRISDVGRFVRLNKGDVLAVRSLRNLQEIRKQHAPKPRPHRKIGDF